MEPNYSILSSLLFYHRKMDIASFIFHFLLTCFFFQELTLAKSYCISQSRKRAISYNIYQKLGRSYQVKVTRAIFPNVSNYIFRASDKHKHKRKLVLAMNRFTDNVMFTIIVRTWEKVSIFIKLL